MSDWNRCPDCEEHSCNICFEDFVEQVFNILKIGDIISWKKDIDGEFTDIWETGRIAYLEKKDDSWFLIGVEHKNMRCFNLRPYITNNAFRIDVKNEE